MNAFFEAAAVAHASGANVRKPPRRKASSTNSTLSRGTNSSLKVNTNTARDDSVISVTPHGSTSHPLLPVTSPTSSFAPTALTETETATTTCFTSSLTTRTDSVVIGGRRYLHQKKESYVLPLDDEESDRLIVMASHFLLKHAFESNFMAPVASVLQEGHPEGQISKVLDIGCGPGTWILEMATDYPNAEFYGVDFYPMFPTTIKPNNTHFQQHDIFESPLPFSDASFDYIYMRTMLICMTRKKLAQILTEIARILKPGGYLEMVDMEYHIQRPGPISEYLINQKCKFYV
ncbi:S-adenosyl-L-methionine-dependent methyltransferase [Spinellus fusiger]|nr:S-adenosyl-L-methionine-dependent methyltransferase [Spinellus fusiger]